MAREFRVAVGDRIFCTRKEKKDAVSTAQAASEVYRDLPCRVVHQNWKNYKGTPIFVNGFEVGNLSRNEIYFQFIDFAEEFDHYEMMDTEADLSALAKDIREGDVSHLIEYLDGFLGEIDTETDKRILKLKGELICL